MTDSPKKVVSGLDSLIVSLDGTTQETYNKYRVNGHLDVVKFMIENGANWLSITSNITDNITISCILPMADGKVSREYIKEVNDILSDLAEENTLEFIDHNSNFCYIDGNVVENLLYDGLHLSDTGAKRYLDNIGLPVVEPEIPFAQVVTKSARRKLQKQQHGNNSGNPISSAPRNVPRNVGGAHHNVGGAHHNNGGPRSGQAGQNHQQKNFGGRLFVFERNIANRQWHQGRTAT